MIFEILADLYTFFQIVLFVGHIDHPKVVFFPFLLMQQTANGVILIGQNLLHRFQDF